MLISFPLLAHPGSATCGERGPVKVPEQTQQSALTNR